ncbi:hypothetical protein Tco_0068837 [Tanacetum coccineum]
MFEIDPEPPNPPPPIDKSNEFTKTHKKSDKKSDKSLKPRKTNRTINLDPNVTMKHVKLLSGNSQVNIKKIVTSSGSKESVAGIVDEGMKDGVNDEEGIEAEDDVTDDGLVSEEGLGVNEVRGEVGKEGDADKRVFGNKVNNTVSDMFPELNRANLSKNNINSSYVFDSIPVMPPPVESNPMLNPKLNRDSGSRDKPYASDGDLLGEIKRSGWDNNNVQGMRDSKNERREPSGMRLGVKLERRVMLRGYRKPMSFSNIVRDFNNEGRKVVEMDPVIEEGSKN